MGWLAKWSRQTAGNEAPLERGSYVSRIRLDESFGGMLKRCENIVLYGPSRQGKTTLTNRHLPTERTILIECRPNFSRRQIYRVILSSLGYGVLVGKKSKGKASATVKIGISKIGAEAKSEQELEQSLQPVTVDLKNPSEVAHLISGIPDLPWLILNNFQLLSRKTKSDLLFDLSFFAERPNIHFMIVGNWSYREYLEELEPSCSGKFSYLEVPFWGKSELNEAAMQWSNSTPGTHAAIGIFQDLVEASAGDISLLHSLCESRSSIAGGTLSANASAQDVQELVLQRFQRSLTRKYEALLLERGSYVRYLGLGEKTHVIRNSKYVWREDLGETTINPQTGMPYQNGKSVSIDRSGNPALLERVVQDILWFQIDLASFVFRLLHRATLTGESKIEIATVLDKFEAQLSNASINIDRTRLRSAIVRLDEVQRKALVVPPIFKINSIEKTLDIADRRLVLLLQKLSPDDIEEIIEDARPRKEPTARQRNYVSQDLNPAERLAYLKDKSAVVERDGERKTNSTLVSVSDNEGSRPSGKHSDEGIEDRFEAKEAEEDNEDEDMNDDEVDGDDKDEKGGEAQ